MLTWTGTDGPRCSPTGLSAESVHRAPRLHFLAGLVVVESARGWWYLKGYLDLQ